MTKRKSKQNIKKPFKAAWDVEDLFEKTNNNKKNDTEETVQKSNWNNNVVLKWKQMQPL